MRAMFLKRTVLFFYLLSFSSLCDALTVTEEEWVESNGARAVVVSVVSNALVRTDEALLNSIGRVNTNKLKGDFAESLTNQFLKKSLEDKGSWEAVSLSNRSQGLDGLYIKYNSKGQPSSLLVSEVKFGQSPLGASACGKQLSDSWIRCGLSFESNRHNLAGRSTTLKARPSSVNKRLDLIEVNLKDGRKGYFWREGGGSFNYDGPSNTLKEAQGIARTTGTYLDKASKGKVTYRTNLIKVDVVGGKLTLRIGKNQYLLKDVSEIANKHITKSQQKRLLQERLAESLMKSHQGMSTHEAGKVSRKIVNGYALNEALDLNRTLEKERIRTRRLNSIRSATAGAAVGVIFEVVNLLRGEEPNYSSLIANTAIASASSALGTYTNQKYLEASFHKQLQMRTHEHNLRAVKGNKAGISRQAFRRLPGVAVAFGTFEFLSMAYSGDFSSQRIGGVATGAGAGAIGTGAGALTKFSMFAFAAKTGTASTGTAISTLSGAAAKNATLAYWGGGAVSAGGGGMQAGAIFVGGTSFLVATAAVAAAYYGYKAYDEKEKSKILEAHAKLYSESEKGLQTLVSRYVN